MHAPKTYTKAQWDEFAWSLDALPEKRLFLIKVQRLRSPNVLDVARFDVHAIFLAVRRKLLCSEPMLPMYEDGWEMCSPATTPHFTNLQLGLRSVACRLNCAIVSQSRKSRFATGQW